MLTAESLLRDAARLVVWFPLRWLSSLLPIPWVLAIFALMGKMHYVLSRKKRRAVTENMNCLSTEAGGTRQINMWVRQYFEVHYLNQLIIFLFPRLNEKNIGQIHSFTGLENLEKELSKGRGCILVHPHFGPVHLPLFHLGLMGYDVSQLGYLRKPRGLSRIGEKVSFRLREKYEGMIPARIIPGNQFLRPAFKHLEKNGTLMITGDGTGGGEFVGRFEPFPFVGKTMLFPVGPSLLALKTGASLLPMFTVPGENNWSYTTVIEEPIHSSDIGDMAEVTDPTLRFLARFESHLKRYPGSVALLG